jgi:hypothetical protein
VLINSFIKKDAAGNVATVNTLGGELLATLPCRSAPAAHGARRGGH